MTSRRIIPAAAAAAAALAPAAAAQPPAPTLSWDRPCYTELQPMGFAGAGFTPGGPVVLEFSRSSAVLGHFEARADVAGDVEGSVVVTEDQLIGAGATRETISVTAADRAPAEQDAWPSGSPSAGSTFTFTRWMGFSPGRYVPGRRVQVQAYGWAFAVGEPLYLHFQRQGRTVARVRAGRLSALCGDLTARVRVPRLKSGAYRIVLSTERGTPRLRYTWRKGRVSARAAASAAGGERMRRLGA